MFSSSIYFTNSTLERGSPGWFRSHSEGGVCAGSGPGAPSLAHAMCCGRFRVPHACAREPQLTRRRTVPVAGVTCTHRWQGGQGLKRQAELREQEGAHSLWEGQLAVTLL